MKINKKDIYEIYAIECPNCHEQVELDSKYQREVDCPFCDEEIEIEE